MTDPFESDLIESTEAIYIRAAEDLVDTYRGHLTKPSRFDRYWPKVLYGLMAFFVGLAVFDIWIGFWYLAPFQIGLALLQVQSLRMHRRTVARRKAWNDERLEKLAIAEQKLREADPGNVRLPEVIEEEP